MSKYNSIKFLKKTRARISHVCYKCRKEIKKGEIYYSESIGRINAPGIKLNKFCRICYEQQGDNLLALTQ